MLLSVHLGFIHMYLGAGPRRASSGVQTSYVLESEEADTKASEDKWIRNERLLAWLISSGSLVITLLERNLVVLLGF